MPYLVRSELLLGGLGVLLGGAALLGRGLGGSLLLLGRLLLTGLLALLQLRLGDHLARDIVKVHLADSGGSSVDGGLARGLWLIGHGAKQWVFGMGSSRVEFRGSMFAVGHVRVWSSESG